MKENEAITVLKMVEAHGSLTSKAKEMAIQALEEIQQYRAIGTIDGFKALKEKNEPKKPQEISWGATKCPICGQEFGFNSNFNHCSNCGQRIDFGEEE